jgi:hypothetical protein
LDPDTQGMKRVMYPSTPDGWADWECPIRMIVPVTPRNVEL